MIDALPDTILREAKRNAVDWSAYPPWLLRLAQAWWAVLPPTRCSIRHNGEEKIIDTFARTGAVEAQLRLDWVECRVRLNGNTLSWATEQATDPPPSRGFYAAFDGLHRLTPIDVTILVTVLGTLAYPGKSFDPICQ